MPCIGWPLTQATELALQRRQIPATTAGRTRRLGVSGGRPAPERGSQTTPYQRQGLSWSIGGRNWRLAVAEQALTACHSGLLPLGCVQRSGLSKLLDCATIERSLTRLGLPAREARRTCGSKILITKSGGLAQSSELLHSRAAHMASTLLPHSARGPASRTTPSQSAVAAHSQMVHSSLAAAGLSSSS